MVLWCKCCAALVGISFPYTDWTVNRDALCPSCAEREQLIEREANACQGPHHVRLREDASTLMVCQTR